MYEPHDLNKNKNFIAGWFINPKVCDNLIAYYETQSFRAKKGMVFDHQTGDGYVDANTKDSFDLACSRDTQEENQINYLQELSKVCDLYLKEYFYANETGDRFILEKCWNVQKYNPGQAFKIFHFERGNALNSKRYLVFMTYLNDVKDGGGTEFYYQNQIVKAQKGLTIIWPSEWTHVHRGLISNSETKYIATGWYGFYE